MSQNSRTENQFTFITTSIYQTSEEREIGHIGSRRRPVLGAAINFIYGLTDILYLENDTIKYKQGIIMVPDGFETLYTYNEYNIIHSVIPQLMLIGDTASPMHGSRSSITNTILNLSPPIRFPTVRSVVAVHR